LLTWLRRLSQLCKLVELIKIMYSYTAFQINIQPSSTFIHSTKIQVMWT
jgi:hypothetical protein